MPINIVDHLREVEVKAAQMISSARKKASKITANAKINAETIIDKSLKDADDMREQILAEGVKKQKEDVKKIETASEKEKSAIEKSASKNIRKAKDMVVERIKA